MSETTNWWSAPSDCRHDDPHALVVDLVNGQSKEQYCKFKDNKTTLLLLVSRVSIIDVKEWLLIDRYCKNLTELHIEGHWLTECDSHEFLFQILSTFSKLVYVDAKCFGWSWKKDYWKLPNDLSPYDYSPDVKHAAKKLIQKVRNNRKEFQTQAVKEMVLFLNVRDLCKVAVGFLFN